MNKQTIANLIDGSVSWEELQEEILPDPKDPNRFAKVLEVIQDRVDWSEPILVPLNDHLFVVKKDGERIVKSECGHEYCHFDENWKQECQVHVREGPDEMDDLYDEWMTVEDGWSFQIREFFCPECYKLVDVDAVPAGYPVLQGFRPDIDEFYSEWIGKLPSYLEGENIVRTKQVGQD